MAVNINKLTNANVYLDGISLLGKAEEVELPMLKAIMAEHKALGLLGKLEFFAGFEKMTAKIKWNSFYADTMKKVGNVTTSMKLQIRSSLESFDSSGRTAQKPVVVYITATSTDFPYGNFKQHDNVEAETNFSVYSCKMEIEGQAIVEFDALANIYKVNGVDVAATYKINLGI
jgi:uncharacterized protein